MLPEISPATADALRTALDRADYRTDGVRVLLGREAHAALGRGEPEPAFRATADGGPLGVLVRMLLLGSVEPDAAVAAALAPLAPADAAAAGLLRRRRRDGVTGWAAALDLRPHGADDGGEWWVLSDLDARRQERDHVTGVGGGVAHARLRDAPHARRHGARPRHRLRGPGAARRPARPCRHGDRRRAARARDGRGRRSRSTTWTSSCSTARGWRRSAGRRFDLIVSNPPFVPGPARVDYVYRDSGQAGDDALAALVRALPAHLEPGGVAQLLGSWLHVRGEDWPDRVRSWLPGGVDAWIVQREVTDPALHVGTWQRDAGLDLHSPAARAQAGAWLDWLAAQKVEAVGFGFLTLRRIDPGRTDATPTVVVEDLPDELTDPLGPEVAGWLDRVDWLRAHATDDALLGARLRLADGVVLERWATQEGRRQATTGGSRRAPWSPGRRARGGGTRWTSRPPHCSRAAGARCRCASWWSCSRSRTTGRSTRWSPQPCPRCASWCGTACWCRSTRRHEGRRRPGHRAAVRVEGEVVGEIGPGLLVLLGVHRDDPRAARRSWPASCTSCASSTGSARARRRGRRSWWSASSRSTATRARAGGRRGRRRRHRTGRGRWSTRWSPRCGRGARRWRPGCSARRWRSSR